MDKKFDEVVRVSTCPGTDVIEITTYECADEEDGSRLRAYISREAAREMGKFLIELTDSQEDGPKE